MSADMIIQKPLRFNTLNNSYFITSLFLFINITQLLMSSHELTPPKLLNYASQQKNHATRNKENILNLAYTSKNTSQEVLAQIEQAITNNFGKIHKILDQFDHQLNIRLQVYQRQLLAVVKQEISQMNLQTRKLVNELQDKIMQKQGNELIWHLRNQSDFFKHEALKLFELNKELRLQVKLLKQSLHQYQNRFEIKDMLLEKLKKKQLKERQKMTKKASNTKISNSHFTQLIESGPRPIRILKTIQRLQAEKRFKPKQSIESAYTTHKDANIMRHKTEGEKDRLLGHHSNLNLSPINFQLNCSQPQLKITKLQIQNSRANINKSCLSQFFERMQKGTQTQANHCSPNKETNNQKGRPHLAADRQCSFTSKQINFQKNGFIINYPSQAKKQKSLRKSSEYTLFKLSREMVNMNETFIKNKLNSKSNDAKRSTQKHSLFAKNQKQ